MEFFHGVCLKVKEKMPLCFEFVLKTTDTCLECGKESIRQSEHLNMSCAIESEERKAFQTIQECVTNFFSLEEVTVRCSECPCEQAFRFQELVNAPDFIVIDLKRYRWFGNAGKLMHHVNIGKNLDILVGNDQYVYELYAVITHRGVEVTSGHYVAYLKVMNGWALADDDNVSSMRAPIFQGGEPYVCFYEKKIHSVNTSEMPQTSERSHGSWKKMLRYLLGRDDETNWVAHIPELQRIMNQRSHKAFSDKMTPFEVFFARKHNQGEGLQNGQMTKADSVDEENTSDVASSNLTAWENESASKRKAAEALSTVYNAAMVKGHKNRYPCSQYEPGHRVLVNATAMKKTKLYSKTGPKCHKGVILKVGKMGRKYQVLVKDSLLWVDISMLTSLTRMKQKKLLGTKSPLNRYCMCVSKCKKTRAPKCENYMHRDCCKSAGKKCALHNILGDETISTETRHIMDRVVGEFKIVANS
ncbi:uncharacterized protein LOC141914537 [Tubulanus polymorphus]|uniref:uncharacterized protein LOC141914537 n=1 Tax=Tubulanus polymorphus TaxID=672921 RepID=UPI003DA442F9